MSFGTWLICMVVAGWLLFTEAGRQVLGAAICLAIFLFFALITLDHVYY